MILDILSWVLFAAGTLFIVAGSTGLLRFPDFYTRVHAAGVTDTLGVELFLFAMILQSGGNVMAMIKLALIAAFMFLTSPVATHAIAHAAWVGRLRPLSEADIERKAAAHNTDADETAGDSDTQEAR